MDEEINTHVLSEIQLDCARREAVENIILDFMPELINQKAALKAQVDRVCNDLKEKR